MAKKGNKNAEKQIDWSLVDKLLEINATGEEIATVLNVNYDTIQNHCKKEKNMLFSEYIKKGNENFKISLKRLQFRSAKGVFTEDENRKPRVVIAPSVTMQIWLGKQYLGQKERIENKNTNTTEIKVVTQNEQDKKDIEKLLNEIDDN